MIKKNTKTLYMAVAPFWQTLCNRGCPKNSIVIHQLTKGSYPDKNWFLFQFCSNARNWLGMQGQRVTAVTLSIHGSHIVSRLSLVVLQHSCTPFQNTFIPKPQELRSWYFVIRFHLPPPVMCHVSHVMYHMSHVMCHMSLNFCLIFCSDKVVKLVGGGSVINGAYPV